jgi:hypothetical protein
LINSSQNNSNCSYIKMEASDDSQNAPSKSGDAPIDDEKSMEEYSAESRTYHAYFDEVSTSAYDYQKYLLTTESSYEPIFAATTLGAVTTASLFCSSLAFRVGPRSRLCSCFRHCLDQQSQSSAWERQIWFLISSIQRSSRPSSCERIIER